MKTQDLIKQYLDDNIYTGLTNMNDGFDDESIKYFNESDFKIILERVESFGLGIHGIEPWINDSCYDVYSSSDYGLSPTDPKWYNKAFKDFISTGENLLYAASFFLTTKNKERQIKNCDECESMYYSDSSQMETLCPECSSVLYEYENCDHNFSDSRCTKCYWDGSTSNYINELKK